MASVLKHKDGWRAFIRRRGVSQSQVFSSKVQAERWAREVEAELDKRAAPAVQRSLTMYDLIEAYMELFPMMGRSKRQALEAIKRELGSVRVQGVTAQEFINYARRRTAGPSTVAIDLSYVRTVLTHTGVVLGAIEECERARVQLDAARKTLMHLRTIRSRSVRRSRRPTPEELARLREVFASELPLERLMGFAIATTLRAGEIVSLRWEDYDSERRSILVRNRKHPTEKIGNNCVIPLLMVREIDPVKLIEEQRGVHPTFIFPYKRETISSLFPRFVRLAGIEDLRFHDLRHEGISRLFEAGYSSPQVALVSGHRTWEQLKRYTNLDPHDLHR